jgi:WD40 repeat protein
LPDGRLLSWSLPGESDVTLKLWDPQSRPQLVLEGHNGRVQGALALPDGRLLSWSEDFTLWLWDPQGRPQLALEGHKSKVQGALALPDGRLLSWSVDGTLRLWNPQGEPLAVLKGHTEDVQGAQALPDGRLLSWSLDKTLRLWDNDGRPLEVYPLEEGRRLYPEERKVYLVTCGTAVLFGEANFAFLDNQKVPPICWHGASKCKAWLLRTDGWAVVTQNNGQVCVLQLYHGNRPISLDDLEAMAPAGAGSHDNGDSPGRRTLETTV